MGCCGAAWEICSSWRKPAATCIVEGCKEKYHSRDYIYKLPNLKKEETGNFIAELVCPGCVPWVTLVRCFQLLLLQLSVPCQPVSFTSWLCSEEAGRGCAEEQACSRASAEHEFATFS